MKEASGTEKKLNESIIYEGFSVALHTWTWEDY